MLSDIIDWIFLPPGLSCLLILFGLIAVVAWRRIGYSLIISGLITLYLISVPISTHILADSLEPESPLSLQKAINANVQAIVVIGSGRNLSALEYGELNKNKNIFEKNETIDQQTLASLKYASFIHKSSGLPIIVSGGQTDVSGSSRAEIMKQILEDDFGVITQIWLDPNSVSPYEHAVNSHNILVSKKVSNIILICPAWQMKRVKKSFDFTGIMVISAPVSFYDRRRSSGVKGWLPQGEATGINSKLLRELVANMLYDVFLVENKKDS
ncbi:MAG: YdcF family protein [Gammaproteobacteria bacterium]|nr:MAG: YdcF family protein [Gammaproteobacteria bacterium]